MGLIFGWLGERSDFSVPIPATRFFGNEFPVTIFRQTIFRYEKPVNNLSGQTVHNYFIGGYMDKQRGIEQAEETLETLAQAVDKAEAIFAKAVQFGKRAFVLADEFLDNLDTEIKKTKDTAPPKGATGAGTNNKAGTDNNYDRVRDLLFIQGHMLEKHGYDYCKKTVWFSNPETISDNMVRGVRKALEDYDKKNKATFN